MDDLVDLSDWLRAERDEMEAKRDRVFEAREKELARWRWWLLWLLGDYLPERTARWLWWYRTSRAWG